MSQELLVKYPDVMCVWYIDCEISISVRRKIKNDISRSFLHSLIVKGIQDLTKLIKRCTVVKHVVFILTMKNEKDIKHVEKLLENRSKRETSTSPKFTAYTYEFSISADDKLIHDEWKRCLDKIMQSLRQNTQVLRIQDEEKENFDPLQGPPQIIDSKHLTGSRNSFHDLPNESLSFLLFQTMIQILLEREYNESHIRSMCDIFEERDLGDEGIQYLRNIRETGGFNSIHCYTHGNLFVSKTVNKALTTEDVRRILKLGCYLGDLHCRLANIDNNEEHIVLYRGKQLENANVEKFKASEGHLISFKGLLSTTRDTDIAVSFASPNDIQNGKRYVVMKLLIHNPAVNLPRPFADIAEHSITSTEAETLFFTGFIWRIKSVRECTTNDCEFCATLQESERFPHWCMVLEAYSEHFSWFQEKVEEDEINSRRYSLISNVLCELGDYAKLQELYADAMDENLSEEIQNQLLNCRAQALQNEGKQLDALEPFMEITRKLKSMDTTDSEGQAKPHPILAEDENFHKSAIRNNMAVENLKTKNHEVAEQNFRKALDDPTCSNKTRSATLYNSSFVQRELGHTVEMSATIEESKRIYPDYIYSYDRNALSTNRTR